MKRLIIAALLALLLATPGERDHAAITADQYANQHHDHDADPD